ncbi:MAG: hypothetical protein AAF462_07080 [Thermodesulfobacteriota bacterium]
MIKQIFRTSSLVILVIAISFSLSTYLLAGDGSGCEQTYPKVTLETSVENNFNFEKTSNVVLLEGTCSQLKSGACGTGTCEKGWKCMDTGIQCLCSPPQ